jgi:hypothetical protein
MRRVHSAGEIFAKLRLVDELSSTGRVVGNAVQAIVPGVSERRAWRVLGQHRSTQRKVPKSINDGGHDNGHRQDHPT